MFALPLESVREFIESSGLVNQACLPVEAVHKAFVELAHKTRTRDAPPAERGERATAVAEKRDEETAAVEEERCACGSRIFVADDRHGDRICAKCGICSYGFVYSNCTLFEGGATVSKRARAATVDQKVIAHRAHAGSSADDARRELNRELDHWNDLPVGTHLGTDEMARARIWAGYITHASTTVKAISALLFDRVAAFADPALLEDAMRQGRPMPTLAPPSTNPSGHRCARCGAEVDCAYAAKRHPCGWGSKKRRRW